MIKTAPVQPGQPLRDASAIGLASTGIGAALTTIVASACCVSPVVAPLIVGLIGASGAAWAAGLKPYSWYFLGAGGLFLGVGFWMVYRPRPACPVDTGSGAVARQPWMPRVVKGVLWVGAVVWAASVLVHVILP